MSILNVYRKVRELAKKAEIQENTNIPKDKIHEFMKIIKEEFPRSKTATIASFIAHWEKYNKIKEYLGVQKMNADALKQLSDIVEEVGAKRLAERIFNIKSPERRKVCADFLKAIVGDPSYVKPHNRDSAKLFVEGRHIPLNLVPLFVEIEEEELLKAWNIEKIEKYIRSYLECQREEPTEGKGTKKGLNDMKDIDVKHLHRKGSMADDILKDFNREARRRVRKTMEMNEIIESLCKILGLDPEPRLIPYPIREYKEGYGKIAEILKEHNTPADILEKAGVNKRTIKGVLHIMCQSSERARGDLNPRHSG